MKIGILGSGFGFYGYLPAICGLGFTPVILQDRRSRLRGRLETADFESLARFCESETELYENSDALVIATTPPRQTQLIDVFLKNEKVKHYFLEKPLGIDSNEELRLMKNLEVSKSSFSIGYLFLWTDWFSALGHEFRKPIPQEIRIDWIVSKPLNTWKTDETLGGGLVSFYAPHLFSVFHSLGIDISEISIKSLGNELNMMGTFADGKVLEVALKYGDAQRFKIIRNSPSFEVLFIDETPFGPQNRPGIKDSRIPVIKRYLTSTLSTPEVDFYGICEFSIAARRIVEKQLKPD